MLAMIKDEPEDKYIPVLKPVLEALLNENKMLRRKNSQLGGKVARMRRALNGMVLSCGIFGTESFRRL